MRWLNLEPIVQSEVSQKEKDKYCILIAYVEFRKTLKTILPAGQQRRHVKNRLLDSVGEDKDGMIWENSIETCTLPYVK